MGGRLFGTDGVRGVANTELTVELALGLGRAAVKYLGTDIVIGRDTRRSGEMLESALAAGIMSAGGNAYVAGVLPTPAVAFLTNRDAYNGGVVISASHNPPRYNGIKFFDANGFKLPDALEDEMQAYIEAGCPDDQAIEGEKVGHRFDLPGADLEYVQNAIDIFTGWGLDLAGLKIVVDAGHGAAWQTTPLTLRRLGAEVIALNDDFSGDDINVECGSTNLAQLKAAVVEHRADIGLAHDGDADRLQAVDRNGNEVDGDQIEAICAIDLKQRGLLVNDTVVSTVMCNLGFKKAMEAAGIQVVCTKVGDRYVLEEMRAHGHILGGEQSGHMIFLEHNTTGDGLITALNLLAAMRRARRPLHELAAVMEHFPQSLVNVEVADKQASQEAPAVIAKIAEVEKALGSDGRVLVRPSGTESLVRVLVEAADDTTAQAYAEQIAAAISEADVL